MYIGHRHKRIITVTERAFEAPDLKVLKVPSSLHVSPEDLMLNYEVWREQIVLRSEARDYKNLKVAFVGVYNIRCGISTYAEALFPAIGALVGDFKVFAEKNGMPSEGKVVRCWERGKPMLELIDAIHAYAPDVVLVQHEYGIFPVARHWLSFMFEMQHYRTFVTLHSVYKHKDKTICEAAIPNLVVHTNIGRDILKNEKKVPGKVSVIPHFCVPGEGDTKYWNLYHSPHTLVQFGFGFRYKGWEQGIEVVDKLKTEFPEIFFTGLFSESDFSRPQHDQYFYELYDLIRSKKLTQHISIIRGYQSDETLDSFLRTNQVALFPYIDNGEHTVYGCSGAARFAMRKGIPVITSNAPLFDDLEGVCPRPKSVDEICDHVRKLFTEQSAVRAQMAQQRAFLERNSLGNIAKAYAELFSSAS